jgi:hypothetical protein
MSMKLGRSLPDDTEAHIELHPKTGRAAKKTRLMRKPTDLLTVTEMRMEDGTLDDIYTEIDDDED